MLRFETTAYIKDLSKKINSNIRPSEENGELVFDENHFQFNKLVVPYRKIKTIVLTTRHHLFSSSHQLFIKEENRSFTFASVNLSILSAELPIQFEQKIERTTLNKMRFFIIAAIAAIAIISSLKFVVK